MLPTEARFKALTEDQLQFLHYWGNKVDRDNFARLEELLGVMWNRDDFSKKIEMDNPAKPERVRIRLAEALNPELRQVIKKTMGLS